jgi:hypothetical protein
MRHLRAFIYARKVREQWHEYLPYVQKILNSCPHSVTKVAPIDLHFPDFATNSVEQQDYLQFLDETAALEVTTEWNKRNTAYYRDLVDIAAMLQNDIDAEHRASIDAQQLTIYEDNTWVLALPHRGRGEHRAQDDKTKAFYSGPYQVKSHLGNTYTVWDAIQDKLLEYHVTSLKEFRFNPAITDPREIAMADTQEFRVGSILSHEWRDTMIQDAGAEQQPKRRRGQGRKRSQLYFLVHWAGYESSEDSWEPWKNVMHVDKIKTYCLEHDDLKFLFP